MEFYSTYGQPVNPLTFTSFIQQLNMEKSTITIDVTLDEARVPHQISWNATGSSAEENQRSKAMVLSFWDPQDRAALRIDLWTKDMMVDEMGDFFYQTMMTMADTYRRATGQAELAEAIKLFAGDFYKKSQELSKSN